MIADKFKVTAAEAEQTYRGLDPLVLDGANKPTIGRTQRIDFDLRPVLAGVDDGHDENEDDALAIGVAISLIWPIVWPID